MKIAKVIMDKTGYWMVIDQRGNQVGGLCDSELEAYKTANYNGYIVN